MNDLPADSSDKRLEFAKSGSLARRQRPSEVVARARNLKAAQRSKMLFDDEAEMDLSEDLGEDETDGPLPRAAWMGQQLRP